MSSKNSLYIQSLILKNFATFDHQEINFDKGFNAIIGETGSGKSLILEALQILLGGRADKKLIRKDSEFAHLEAIFVCPGPNPELKRYFQEIGHPLDEEEQEIFLKRIIYSSGKSKSYINFSPCNVNSLVDFSRNFIDLVGQFENQKLLSESYQINLIDSFGEHGLLLQEYQKEFRELNALQKEYLQLQSDQKSIGQKTGFLEYQISEISQLDPSVEDEKILLAQKREYQQLEKRGQAIHEILQHLSDNDHGSDALSLLKKSVHIFHKNLDFLDGEILQKIEESLNRIEEASYELVKSIKETPSDFSLEEIMERLDFYQKIKRKYGIETEGLVKLKIKLQEELEELKTIDKKLEDLDRKIGEKKNRLWEVAKNLHRLRKLRGKEISTQLTKIVRQLKMTGATLQIDFRESRELLENGISQISFLAETNPGEGLFPVKEVASGGELSRILLAFRQVLAAKDSISIFLFDEIDTGMGGVTALRIGNALLKVSNTGQVVAITHLPQIAYYADKLIVVSKVQSYENNGKRTRSSIKEVTGKLKKEEILAMVPLEMP